MNTWTYNYSGNKGSSFQTIATGLNFADVEKQILKVMFDMANATAEYTGGKVVMFDGKSVWMWIDTAR